MIAKLLTVRNRMRIAIVNGGKYLPNIRMACKHRKITEWDDIPIEGNYDILMWFIDPDIDTKVLYIMRKSFNEYIAKFPDIKWIILTEQRYTRFNKTQYFSTHNTVLFNTIHFNYPYTKYFRAWSYKPFKMALRISDRFNRPMYKMSKMKERLDEPMVRRRYELLQIYGEKNPIPIPMVEYIIQQLVHNDKNIG